MSGDNFDRFAPVGVFRAGPDVAAVP